MQSSPTRPARRLASIATLCWWMAVALWAVGLSAPTMASADGSEGGGEKPLTPEQQIEEERRAESRRFAVGLSFTSGVLIAQQNATVRTQANVQSVPDPPAAYGWPEGAFIQSPEPFGRDLDKSLLTVSPNFGATIDILTPALGFIPLKPRLVAVAEILPTFAGSVTVALDGAATRFLIQPASTSPRNYPASVIGGQGTRIDSQVMTTTLAASVGISFDTTYRGRLIRLRPGVGWIRWGLIAEGKVLAAYKGEPDPLGSAVLPPPSFGQNFRFIQMGGRAAGFFNGVGPTIEIEMELQRRGSFRPSLYLTGGGFKTVGNNELNFSAKTSVDDALGEADYEASWKLQVQDWNYRMGLGFRVRWVGL